MGTAFAAININYTKYGGSAQALSSALGTSISYITTKALDIGDNQMTYIIDKINTKVTKVKEQTEFYLEIYGSEYEDGPFSLLDTLNLSLKDPGYTDPPGCRYYKFKFIDRAVMNRWKLHGFDVYGEPCGDEY